jgi:SagB-type dehydrogenase family enzyme
MISDISSLQPVYTYHQESKHHLNRYAPGPGGMDWATQPEPFRTFSEAATIDLPLQADSVTTSFDDIRVGARPAPAPLTLKSLAVLLELSLGLSAWKVFQGSRWALRCNPSSGNLHPTEGYVIAAGVQNLAAGVYHYVSRDHLLETRAVPLRANWGNPFASGLIIALTSIHWREAWKYGLRAFRYCQHDCGHAMAAISYGAATLGWKVGILNQWSDEVLAASLGLNRTDDFETNEHEVPEIAVWVGPEPIPESFSPESLGRDLQFFGRANRLSPSHRIWQGINDVDRACQRPEESASDALPMQWPPLERHPNSISAATLIRQRRSAVAFDGVTSMSSEHWFSLLDSLLPFHR